MTLHPGQPSVDPKNIRVSTIIVRQRIKGFSVLKQFDKIKELIVIKKSRFIFGLIDANFYQNIIILIIFGIRRVRLSLNH